MPDVVTLGHRDRGTVGSAIPGQCRPGRRARRMCRRAPDAATRRPRPGRRTGTAVRRDRPPRPDRLQRPRRPPLALARRSRPPRPRSPTPPGRRARSRPRRAPPRSRTRSSPSTPSGSPPSSPPCRRAPPTSRTASSPRAATCSRWRRAPPATSSRLAHRRAAPARPAARPLRRGRGPLRCAVARPRRGQPRRDPDGPHRLALRGRGARADAVHARPPGRATGWVATSTTPTTRSSAAANYLQANGADTATGVDRALRATTTTPRYVRAVRAYAGLMAADERAFLAFHAWEVYFRTTSGRVHLPVGYDEPARDPGRRVPRPDGGAALTARPRGGGSAAMTLLDASDLSVDVLEAAPRLLGAELVADTPEGEVRVRVVEVEAYRGADDPGLALLPRADPAQRRHVGTGRAPLRLLRLRHALLRQRRLPHRGRGRRGAAARRGGDLRPAGWRTPVAPRRGDATPSWPGARAAVRPARARARAQRRRRARPRPRRSGSRPGSGCRTPTSAPVRASASRRARSVRGGSGSRAPGP